MIGRGMLAASRECLPPSGPVAREINPMTKTNWEETGSSRTSRYPPSKRSTEHAS